MHVPSHLTGEDSSKCVCLAQEQLQHNMQLVIVTTITGLQTLPVTLWLLVTDFDALPDL